MLPSLRGCEDGSLIVKLDAKAIEMGLEALESGTAEAVVAVEVEGSMLGSLERGWSEFGRRADSADACAATRAAIAFFMSCISSRVVRKK